MNDTTTESASGRRSFLDALLGIGVVGWMATAIYPVLRYLTPLQQAGASGPIHLTDEEQAKVESESFTIVRSGSTRLIVLKDNESKIHALAAKCTHEGCTVQFVPGEGLVWCACHNAKFDVSGRVVAGPPPRPLATYAVTTDPEGKLIVSVEEQS